MGFFDFLRAENAVASLPSESQMPLSRLEQRIDLLMGSFGISFRETNVGALPAEVQQAINAGQKIQAIKLYRDRTGVGLAEAKAAVEQGHAGGEDSCQRLERKLDLVLSELNIAPSEAAVLDTSSGFTVEIEALLRRNQLIPAIKRYREHKGVGLKEAKDAIDAWKRRIDAQDR